MAKRAADRSTSGIPPRLPIQKDRLAPASVPKATTSVATNGSSLSVALKAPPRTTATSPGTMSPSRNVFSAAATTNKNGYPYASARSRSRSHDPLCTPGP